MKLQNKVVVISGGSGGIGSAIVEALHAKGAIVYSLDVDKKAAQAIEGIHYIPVDLTDGHQVAEVMKLIPDSVDALVLSAGVMRRGTIFDISEENYDLLLNANLKSSWLLLKHIKPKLVEDATVVQISSGHALHPEPDPGIYTLTKKATAALAEILELTCPNYDVKTVYPGPVLTKLLLTDRSEMDKERIHKIAHKPEFLAEKIIALMESSNKSLQFDHDSFSYAIR